MSYLGCLPCTAFACLQRCCQTLPFRSDNVLSQQDTNYIREVGAQYAYVRYKQLAVQHVGVHRALVQTSGKPPLVQTILRLVHHFVFTMQQTVSQHRCCLQFCNLSRAVVSRVCLSGSSSHQMHMAGSNFKALSSFIMQLPLMAGLSF